MDRSDYRRGELNEGDLDSNPIAMLATWIQDARFANVIEPSAMCVSTVGSTNFPSSRMVLLRGLDNNGLTFYTNTQSRKCEELELNPGVCANFWWAQLERQVRVEGKIERASDSQADRYFAERPRKSQIAAHASPQSQVIASRSELESSVQNFEKLFPETVPRPENWGGFNIVPHCFEFWQGRRARTHDRFRYRWVGSLWAIDRLAP